MAPSPNESVDANLRDALIVNAAATATTASRSRRRRPWRAAAAALLLACAAVVVVVVVLASVVDLGPTSLRIWPPSVPRSETRATDGTLANIDGFLNESDCACPTNSTGVAADEKSTPVAANDHGTPPSSPSPSLAASLGLGGNVSECCCTFSDLEVVNAATVRPLLERIVRTPFFAHFEVDLCSGCRLWDDSPMCVLRDCAVCECDDPPGWAVGGVAGGGERADGGVRHAATVAEDSSRGDDCEHVEDGIVTKLDPRVSDGWPQSYSFPEERRMATAVDSGSEDDDAAVVVDLRLNPERYTGYGGRSAARVWSAIHSTNCFQPPPRLVEEGARGGTNGTDGNDEEREGGDPAAHCLLLPEEQRLYNRIISGMHSSISLHIANSYCQELDPDNLGECRRWGRDASVARERVLDHPDRIENLYVAFAVLLRAVVRAGPAVTAAVPRDDPLYADGLAEWTDELLPMLEEMARRCPRAFDESRLLVGGGAGGDGGDGVVGPGGVRERRSELRRRFRHLREIMRCVGCDRCKLWGTLQALGIETALRVLLGEDGEGGGGGGGGGGDVPTTLSRQEAVALVNTLERFSAALVYAQKLRGDVPQ